MSDENISTGNGKPTADQIASWKREHGKVIGIDEPARMYFRKPTRPIWADFVESVAKGKGTYEAAYRRLCLACLLHPAEDAAEQIFEEYPGLSLTMGDELGELAGHKGKVDVKKL